MEARVSVIIPIYNEERTISSIVEIVRSWGKAGEIIVVNDGSTDKSLKALKQFKGHIHCITYKKNKGKGYALVSGIKKSSGDILLFLDGDVTGLTHRDLDRMLAPVVSGKADMVLGLARFWGMGGFEPFNDVTGLRVMKKDSLVTRLDQMKDVGRGVEFIINDLHKNKKVKLVKLPHVFIFGKFEKEDLPSAMLSYVKEAREFLSAIMKLQSKDLPPQAKQAFRVAQHYIRRAFSYVQQVYKS